MRTLQLTHEQIEPICHALGIAEKVYLDNFRDLKDNLIRINGKQSSPVPIQFLLDKSFEICSLCADIEDSKFDV